MITPEIAMEWYANADPVHNFDHIMRVYRMAIRVGAAENADLTIIKAAALLHDAGGNDLKDAAARKQHHLHAADIAGKIMPGYGYTSEQIEQVQHCIRAHRFRGNAEKPETIEAKTVFDADKLDSIGAIGIARVHAFAALAEKPFYFPPSAQFLDGQGTVENEPHSAYHEYLFKLSKIKDRLFTVAGKKIAEDRHNYMVAYFDRLVSEWGSEL